MAVTLEQAKLNTQDMLVKGTIDEFQNIVCIGFT